MNELIRVRYDSENPTVSARELHEFLGVATQYKDWFPRMCEYGFIEGLDFCSFLSESTGGRPAQDAAIIIEMAKEIAMLQRNEKGKQARHYFIQLEKAWNSPEKVMARALKIAETQIKTLSEKITQDKPKVIFADAVTASHTSILVGELAKLLHQNGVEIGQNRLFDWLRQNGFLISRNGSDYNMPTQKSMELGLFEIKERTINEPNGSIRVTKTTKVTGKGQQYFLNKFLKEARP